MNNDALSPEKLAHIITIMQQVNQIENLKSFSQSSEIGRKQTREWISSIISTACKAADLYYSKATPYFFWSTDYIGVAPLVNPDNKYQYALIEEGGEYSLEFTRGTHCQLNMQILLGDPFVSFPPSGLDIDFTDMKPNEKKTITFGGVNADYPLPIGAYAFLVRQIFADWENEALSQVKIKRLNTKPVNAVREGDKLSLITDILSKSIQFQCGFAGSAAKVPVNTIFPPKLGGANALAGQVSIMARYQIADDEALILVAEKSNAQYQGVSVANPLAVVPDFSLCQGSLSLAQVNVADDNMIYYVIAKKDPQVHNWLDTQGNNTGIIMMRWQGLEGLPMTPTIKTVKLDALFKYLPVNTPHMTDEMRNKQLNARQTPPCVK